MSSPARGGPAVCADRCNCAAHADDHRAYDYVDTLEDETVPIDDPEESRTKPFASLVSFIDRVATRLRCTIAISSRRWSAVCRARKPHQPLITDRCDAPTWTIPRASPSDSIRSSTSTHSVPRQQRRGPRAWRCLTVTGGGIIPCRFETTDRVASGLAPPAREFKRWGTTQRYCPSNTTTGVCSAMPFACRHPSCFYDPSSAECGALEPWGTSQRCPFGISEKAM